MTRKLFSMLLCAFALLLLMGAAPQPAAILAEEESASVSDSDALESESDVSLNQVSSQAVAATASLSPLELEETLEDGLLIDGVCAPAEVDMKLKDGVNYVALAVVAQLLDQTAQVSWDGSTVTITTDSLTLSAKVGQLYLVANGRYLYLPDGVQMEGDRVTVPLWAVAEAFDAQLSWDAQAGVVSLTSGSGAIQSGDAYYDQEDLFWLARVIDAESGNQPLDGKIAVGNVVLNRMNSPMFPNTVYGVVFQRNQFTPAANGSINRTPSAESVVAAKLCLDGANTAGSALYFVNPTVAPGSWASRNRPYVATIGAHAFYG